jgi:metallophosphoesterase (TIGR00282 family)
MPVRLFFIGDIIGKPGRQALSVSLHRIVDRFRIDLVIANGENAAGGFGLTEDTAGELFSQGVHVLTSGNHIWDKKDALHLIECDERILRPANYPPETAGRGWGVYETASGVPVGVINLEGRVFMNNLDCPFRMADELVGQLRRTTAVILVDFHAEATSEKRALGWYLDGRVSAVVGTHTHVQTADEEILPNGTAYLTDAGMTGSFDSVIGMNREQAVRKFVSQMPVKFDVAKRDIRINGVVVEVDEETGRAVEIIRVAERLP